MIRDMSPEVYQSLKRALELGKWPDGRVLSRTQREETMQAIIAWDAIHQPGGQRIGAIDKGRKAGDSCDSSEETPLNWIDRE